MGSLYAGQFAAFGCPEISANAYRVLLRMAIACYDEETAPGANDEGLYYGGWKALTAVLGYGLATDDEPIPPAAKRAVQRAIRELREHGYASIAEKRYQRGHWNRVYRLSLTAWPLDRTTRR